MSILVKRKKKTLNEARKAYDILFSKSDRPRLLERLKLRSKDSIEMDLGEIWC